MNPSNNDFINQYKAISAKIKKRFLKKPNIAEASADFNHLSKRLSESEAWPQASLCSVAVARCEQTLANPSAEVAALIEAARNYMTAEKSCESLNCPNYNENLISAISCYQHAIKVYSDQGKHSLSASLAVELSTELCLLGKHSEALTYLNEASVLLSNSPLDHLTCLNYVAACKVELGDLPGALEVYTQICTIIKDFEEEEPFHNEIFEEFLIRSEIASLLLLLTLQPLPSQMKPEYTTLLERYSSSNYKASRCRDIGLATYLHSLILTCQARDLESLYSLSSYLTSKFSGDLLYLLHALITEMNRT